MQELTSILVAKREKENDDRRFLAAIQGVNLGSSGSEDPQKKWEDLKARAFSGGKVNDSNDILSLTGTTAKQKGFGIGRGLEFSDGNKAKNPFG